MTIICRYPVRASSCRRDEWLKPASNLTGIDRCGENAVPTAPPRLARTVTIGTIRPDRIATTGPLSEPTIPDSPQAAGPAVPEREIGPGAVSGCSAMPGSEKVQPARQSWRIQGGQDTIERHAVKGERRERRG